MINTFNGHDIKMYIILVKFIIFIAIIQRHVSFIITNTLHIPTLIMFYIIHYDSNPHHQIFPRTWATRLEILIFAVGNVLCKYIFVRNQRHERHERHEILLFT